MLGLIRRLFARASERRALTFQARYRHFKALLEANGNVLEIMADISDKLVDPECFSIGDVRIRSTRLFVEAFKIVRHMRAIAPDDGEHLAERFAALRQKASQLLAGSDGSSDAAHILEMNQINLGQTRLVGNKMAGLGEMRAVLDIPVPAGFAITARLDEDLRRQAHLQDEINKITTSLNYEDYAAVQEASHAIQSMVLATPLPDQVEARILAAYDRLREQVGGDLRLAVRSSAIGEGDPRCSFAGLYYTALNVRRQNLIDACYEVLVSKYLPRSIMYLRMNGLRDEDMPMCIGCIAMVDSRVSGTLFTNDPSAGPDTPRMVVQAVSGLGLTLADGRVSPERYTVAREPEGRILRYERGNQHVVLRPRPGDDVAEEPMPDRQDGAPSLREDELAQLVAHALKIERHFGGPQDIEWAIDDDGRVWILQTRPLLISCPLNLRPQTPELLDLCDRYPTLAEAGDCASPGAGIGPVAVVRSVRELKDFPDGGVLVARHAMPELTQVLHKASAVVTEIGGTTGHLAIMAREYKVPCLMNLPGAMSFEPGTEVTVDATARRIYAGRVVELEPLTRRIAQAHPLVGTPVHRILKGIAELVVPLNLTDPKARGFRAANCMTLHDISRFAHETALNRMFALSEQGGRSDAHVHRLIFPVPLCVYVIDAGQGLVEDSPSGEITPAHIASVPFQALIRGMTTDGVRWAGHVPIGLRGFMSVFANTVADPNRWERDLGDRSYAIVSRHYLNFSSRLGYHFSTLDAHVSDAAHGNYVSFTFKGGAADSTCRERRATFIARVLSERGFWVDQKADVVKARIRRIDRDTALDQLDMCGRLMGAARQVDVTMTSATLIDHYVERFMAGDYSLGLATQDG